MTFNMILAAFAFALVLQSGSALKCYTCSSEQSAACADPMNITDHTNNFLARDCVSAQSLNYGYNEHSVCKKTVKKENGRMIVTRSCEIPTPEERGIKNGPCGPNAMKGHYSMISCEICDSDLCNSADSITGSRVFQFLAIALVLSGISSFSF